MKFSVRTLVALLWIVLLGYWMGQDLQHGMAAWEARGIPAELLSLIYIFIFAAITRCIWRGRFGPAQLEPDGDYADWSEFRR